MQLIILNKKFSIFTLKNTGDSLKLRSGNVLRLVMTKIEAIFEREKEEAVRKKAEEVTFNLIFDLFNSGDINREAAMARVGLSDDEFGVQLEKYKQAHMESAVK